MIAFDPEHGAQICFSITDGDCPADNGFNHFNGLPFGGVGFGARIPVENVLAVERIGAFFVMAKAPFYTPGGGLRLTAEKHIGDVAAVIEFREMIRQAEMPEGDVVKPRFEDQAGITVSKVFREFAHILKRSAQRPREL